MGSSTSETNPALASSTGPKRSTSGCHLSVQETKAGAMCMYTEVTCNRHCMCVEDREPLDSCCHWCATPDSTTALRLTSTKRSHCRCGSLKNIQSPLQSPSGGGSPTLSSECSTREFLKARMLQDKGPVLKANVICGGGGRQVAVCAHHSLPRVRCYGCLQKLHSVHPAAHATRQIYRARTLLSMSLRGAAHRCASSRMLAM